MGPSNQTRILRSAQDDTISLTTERFEPGKRYTEVAVDALLQRHHPDSATLRRELVGHGLLERDNSIYSRGRVRQ